MMKKLLALVFATILTFSCASLIGCKKDKNDEPKSDKTSYTFAMISDIHLQREDKTSEEFFKNSIVVSKALAKEKSGNLDGVFIAGDLLDTIWYQRLTYENSITQNDGEKRDAELEYLKTVFDETIPDGTDLGYCLGNHDMTGGFDNYDYSSGSLTESTRGVSSRKYYAALKESDKNYFKNDDTKDHSTLDLSYEQLCNLGLRYQRIALKDFSINFIIVDNETYWKETGTYTVFQLQWIEETLAYINGKYPKEPVFLITHNPVQDTVFGSMEEEGDRDLDSILAKYPNTILFAGHIHKSPYSELALSQDKGFTAVDCGTTKCTNATVYSDGRIDKSEKKYDVHYAGDTSAASEGLLVTVNNDSSVTIERVDYLAKKTIGSAWEIPAIGTLNRNTKYAPANRDTLNSVPYFEENAVTAQVNTENVTNVFFKEAKSGDNDVWAYEVNAYSGSVLSETKLVSTARNIKNFKGEYCVSFTGNVTRVSVTAIDSLYKRSVAKSFTVDRAGKTDGGYDINGFGTTGEQTTGSVAYGDYDLSEGKIFRRENGVLTNLKSSYAVGNSYFNAAGTTYDFSFVIKNARCNRAQTSNGHSDASYRLGAVLASYVYNGRQFSICASVNFSDGGADRTVKNELSYYLLITTPSGYARCEKIELDNCGFKTKALENAAEYKAAMESETGLKLKVVRTADNFEIYLGDTLVDTVGARLSGIFDGTYTDFASATKSAFGIACYGGEADYTNLFINAINY